jgi:RNase adaptor protein for sRNA GlmZ degradation
VSVLLTHVSVCITSFGYGHGPAPRASVTLDVRTLLRNPHCDPAMRYLTGRDVAVRDHVLSTPGAQDLIDNTAALVLKLLRDAGDPNDLRVDVAVGCVGGRHRSVALAEEIGLSLELSGVGVEIEHRDVDKPVLP